jgi:hypothetical protein
LNNTNEREDMTSRLGGLLVTVASSKILDFEYLGHWALYNYFYRSWPITDTNSALSSDYPVRYLSIAVKVFV